MSALLPILPNSPSNFLQQLLAEQSQLTAVERFSQQHDQGWEPGELQLAVDLEAENIERGQFVQTEPPAHYRALLPSTPPSPGEQYSFEVDLTACSGCKACVVACHTLNGLDDNESWRRVGAITIGEESPRLQHVTTACHYCADPGCLNGCPVKAYDKDPLTGIVRHLDDQCIGCKYCTMMCPYEVPSYNARLGIVRKCDMCQQRLAVGEAPACVQACPSQAIAIRVVSAVDWQPSDHQRLSPGAPPSTITLPTTRYVGIAADSLAAGLPHDAAIDRVAESHWPLAVMLVATQASVGLLLMGGVGLWLRDQSVNQLASSFDARLLADISHNVNLDHARIIPSLFSLTMSTTAFVLGLVGLSVASLHLGQPSRAWRVFLGLRTSWLSREAVVFGIYMGLLATTAGLGGLSFSSQWSGTGWTKLLSSELQSLGPSLISTLWFGAVLCGIAGVGCSGMIYIATKRSLWRGSRTMLRSFGSVIVLGCLGAASVAWSLVVLTPPGTLADAEWIRHFAIFGFAAAAALSAAKLCWEWRILLGPQRTGDSSLDRRSRRLIAGELRPLSRLRITVGCLACLLAALASVGAASWASYDDQSTGHVLAVALIVVTAVCMGLGELCERLLYFTSVVFKRMPGTTP